jgi:hypothetical protein
LVCTHLKGNDDPEALEFEVGTLPGGAYLRVPPGRAARDLRGDRVDV